MVTNTRQVSLQEANAQYRKEEAARDQAKETDQMRLKQAIESAFGRSTAKPRKGSTVSGARRKVQE